MRISLRVGRTGGPLSGGTISEKFAYEFEVFLLPERFSDTELILATISVTHSNLMASESRETSSLSVSLVASLLVALVGTFPVSRLFFE